MYKGPTLANSPEHPSNAVAIDLCNCLIVAIYLNIMHSSMTFLNSSLKQLVSGPTVHTLQFECQECDANAFSRLPGRCPGARQGMRQHDHRPHAPSWFIQSEMCRCQKVQSRQSLTCSEHPTPNYFHQGAAFNFTVKEVLSAEAHRAGSVNNQRWPMYVLLYHPQNGPKDGGSCLFRWCSSTKNLWTEFNI